jgi:hypothetical protein
LRIADERRPRAAAQQADARPEIRTDLELVAPATMKLRHAPLPNRIHARKNCLRSCDRLIARVANEVVGGLPGFIICFTHDDMQTNAEGDFPTQPRRSCGYWRDLLGNLLRRLAPGQIFVDRRRCDIDGRVRRAAEIKWRLRLLRRGKKQASVFNAEMFAFKVDGLATQQRRVHSEKFARHFVALIVIEKNAVALILGGIAAGNDID